MAYSPDIVGTDLASRYRADLPTTTVSRREADIAEDWNNQDSIIGFLASGAQNTLDRIVSDVSSGDPDRIVRARQSYAGLQDTLRDNTDKISLIRNYKGGGALAESLRKTAEALGTNAYNQIEVTLPDGRKTTLGLAFNGDGDVLSDPGKGFRDRGFSDADVSAYLGGSYVASDGTTRKSSALQECAHMFMDPKSNARLANGSVFDRNHVQDQEGMQAVSSNWERIESIFGDGAKKFVRTAHNMFLESGAYEHIIPGLLDAAEDYQKKTGLTGARLAASVMSSYRALTDSAVSGPPRGEAGDTSRAMTVPRRQMADAAASKAIAFLRGDNRPADGVFSAKSTAALKKGFALQAYFTASGYDVYKREEGDTMSFSDVLGQFTARAGTAEEGSGVLGEFLGTDTTPGVSARIDGLVGGGTDPRQTVRFDSADPADYLSRVGKTKAGSMSEGADTLADGVKAVLQYGVFRRMMKGRHAGEALTDVAAALEDAPETDPVLSRTRKVFEKSGITDKYAQNELIGCMVDALRTGQRFDFQTVIGELAFGNRRPTVPGTLTEAGKQGLRDWYYGAVAAPLQFADYDRQVRAHLASTEGGSLSAADVNAVVVRMNTARKALIDRFAWEGKPFDPTVLDRAVLGLRSRYTTERDVNGNSLEKFDYVSPEGILKALDPETRKVVEGVLSTAVAPANRRYHENKLAIDMSRNKAYASTEGREAAKPEKGSKGNPFAR